MSIQSPKSKRGNAPGETEAVDSPPESRSGGVVGQQGGAFKASSVPAGLDRSKTGGYKGGNSERDEVLSTHPDASSSGPAAPGSAGFAPKSEDASRKGGQRSGRS